MQQANIALSMMRDDGILAFCHHNQYPLLLVILFSSFLSIAVNPQQLMAQVTTMTPSPETSTTASQLGQMKDENFLIIGGGIEKKEKNAIDTTPADLGHFP